MALFCMAVGVALLRNSSTAFGAVWAALFLVLGVVLLVAFGVLVTKPAPPPPPREVTWDGEPARFWARKDRRFASTMLILALLGGWFLVMGVVGAIEENWLWPLLAAFPAVYFLGIPVLATLGRYRIGGVWLTPTRVVDEHFGRRNEIALADVSTVTPRGFEVRISPTEPSAVRQDRLVPRLWCKRIRPGEMEISTEFMAEGSDALAAEVRERSATVQGGR